MNRHTDRRISRAAALTIIVLAVLLAALVAPSRSLRVVLVDETRQWLAPNAPPRRQFVWRPADRVDVPSVDWNPGHSLIDPQLADSGSVLYFTRRNRDGAADIYRSRRENGKWLPAEAVDSLNSASDDIGPSLSADQRTLFFYSNREGGQGGFDLYRSRWEGGQWGRAFNLGPRVNTSAHEYAPAISPDGQRLYFSSNRTQQHNQRAVPRQADSPARWSATLRAFAGQDRFDLYVSRRDTADGEWQSPAPLDGLNRDDANEGQPFVDAAGAFLYFASDRPARQGERRNFDLYRARIRGDGFVAPENLGGGVNTPANEMDPTLSPDTFQLVFSSDRPTAGERSRAEAPGDDQVYALYDSRSIEIFEDARWIPARLPAIPGEVFWWLALVLLALCFVAALIWYLRQLALKRLPVPTFFLIALLAHLLLGGGMFFVGLGSDLTARVKETLEEIVMDDLRESVPDEQGKPKAYETVSELPPVAPIDVSQTARRESALDVREIETLRLEEVSPAAARQLAPEEVVYVAPPAAPAAARAQLPIRRDAIAMSPEAPTIDVAPVPESASEVVPEPATSDFSVAASRAELPQPDQPVAAMQRASGADERAMPAAMQSEALDAALPPQRTSELRLARAAAGIPLSSNAPIAAPGAAPTIIATDSSHILQLVETQVPLPGRDSAAGPAAPDTSASPAVELGQRATPSALVPQAAGAGAAVTGGEPSASAGTTLARRSPAELLHTPLAESAAIAQIPGPSPALLENTARRDGHAASVDVSPVREQSHGSGLAPAQLTGVDVPMGAARPLGGPPQLSRADLGPPAIADSGTVRPLRRREALPALLLYGEDEIGLEATFSLRAVDPTTKRDLVDAFGGNDQVLTAIRSGLDWLRDHQAENGRWSLERFEDHSRRGRSGGEGTISSDVAATGLALLPFLGDGHTHLSGDYRQTVGFGLAWLIYHQRRSGELTTGWEGNARMYSHGIATIALCEAYGMTRDERLRAAAQAAVDFVAATQHLQSGGWRYQPNQAADTSVVGWQVMALKSAQLAGLDFPEETLDHAVRWLRSVEARRPGRFAYQRGHAPSPAMTAEAMLCLEYLGAGRGEPSLVAAADYLLDNLPQDGKESSYYWYYGTQALFHLQGEHWRRWNTALRDMLLKTQRTRGPAAGTWDPRDQWEVAAGRVYSTSLRLLMLEVYFRHLPLYKGDGA